MHKLSNNYELYTTWRTNTVMNTQHNNHGDTLAHFNIRANIAGTHTTNNNNEHLDNTDATTNTNIKTNAAAGTKAHTHMAKHAIKATIANASTQHTKHDHT